jgi:hypothetical protein
MSGPRRWLEDPRAPGLERDMLVAGKALEPPAGEQERLWGLLAAQLGTGVAASGAGAAAGAAAGKAAGSGVAGLGWLGMAKWALLGVLAGGAVLGTARWVAPPEPEPEGRPALAASVKPPAPVSTASLSPVVVPPPASAPAAVSPGASWSPPPVDPPMQESLQEPAPCAAPSAPSAAPAQTSTAPDPAPASAASSPAVSAEQRVSRLREESRAVALVREALRRGDAPGAAALLDQLQRQFPEAGLAQEREALAIETLARLGRRAEARTRAAAFLNAWPTSVYAQTVRSYL